MPAPRSRARQHRVRDNVSDKPWSASWGERVQAPATARARTGLRAIVHGRRRRRGRAFDDLVSVGLLDHDLCFRHRVAGEGEQAGRVVADLGVDLERDLDHPGALPVAALAEEGVGVEAVIGGPANLARSVSFASRKATSLSAIVRGVARDPLAGLLDPRAGCSSGRRSPVVESGRRSEREAADRFSPGAAAPACRLSGAAANQTQKADHGQNDDDDDDDEQPADESTPPIGSPPPLGGSV
jgi:hypothetical protein